MIRGSAWKDIGAAHSLATLWFIISWKELLYPGTNGYLLASPPPVLEHWAILLNVLIVTFLFFVLIRFSAHNSQPWLQRLSMILFSGAAVVAFAPLSTEFMSWLSPEARRLTFAPLPAAVLIVSVLAMVPNERSLSGFTKNLKILALFFLPFCFVILIKSAYDQLEREDPTLSPASIESVHCEKERKLENRVVWIILDELDAASLEFARQKGLRTDEFDRLMGKSFVAHNAHSPNDTTLVSIPSLLTGRLIKKSRAISAKDLLLESEDGAPFSFRDAGSVFREVKSMGGQSGIAGWYHPYPRVFQDDVSFCYWKPIVNSECAKISDFLRCSNWIWSRPLSILPIVSRLSPKPSRIESVDEDKEEQISRQQYLESKAKDLLSNPNLNLVFLHFSVPHFPYLPQTGRKSDSYFTNIEVANDTLKKVREALETSGQSDRTTLIVSSDHQWREKHVPEEIELVPEELRPAFKQDERIPFIVKLSGQDEHVDYDATFNTVVTKQLILDILSNKVRSAADLELWFQTLGSQSTKADASSKVSKSR